MSDAKHTNWPKDWELRTCDDARGMGYISAGGYDILHVGASGLWAGQNEAIGHLAVAAPDMYGTFGELWQIADVVTPDQFEWFVGQVKLMCEDAQAKARGEKVGEPA